MSNLTEKQEAFLDALFGEAQGDFRQAMNMAGYGEDVSYQSIMRSQKLKDALLERSKDYLAWNLPKAVTAVTNIIDQPTQLGAQNKLKASETVMDRAGLVKTEKQEVEVKSGLFILPAKGDDGED